MKAVTLSNKQEIFVENASNGKAVTIFIASEKSSNGYKKVICLPNYFTHDEIIQELEFADGIIVPMLIDFAKIEDYKAAIRSLYSEVADAMLGINKEEIAEQETESTVSEKKEKAEILKKEVGAVKIFVDYRYENRMIPFYSESQAEFFQYLLDSNSSTFDEIIKKDICTKENANTPLSELKSLYFAILRDDIND